MKYAALLAIAVAMALVAAPLATASNWSDARLDAAATGVAGKPVGVWCETSWSDWIHGGDRVGKDWSGLRGFTFLSAPYVYIAPDVCSTLHALLTHEDVGTLQAADALLTLVHEAVHQRGISNEGQTECTALPLVPGVAVSHFGYAATITESYPFTVTKTVRVKVGRKTVTRRVPTTVMAQRQIANPWLARLATDVQRWHSVAPAEYRTVC